MLSPVFANHLSFLVATKIEISNFQSARTLPLSTLKNRIDIVLARCAATPILQSEFGSVGILKQEIWFHLAFISDWAPKKTDKCDQTH